MGGSESCGQSRRKDSDLSDDESACSSSSEENPVEGGANHGQRASYAQALSASMSGVWSSKLQTADDLRIAGKRRKGGPRAKFFAADNTGKDFSKYYSVENSEEILGSGGYAEVKRGTNIKTKAPRAIKCILRSKVKQKEKLKEEIDTNMRLDHPNVGKIFEVFEDPRFVYIVMELCEGRDLFDNIQEHQYLTETAGAFVMKQLISAVFYMHEQGYAHRDIKPENLLLLRRAPVQGNVLKLIDFGLAKSFNPDEDDQEVFSTKVGTLSYVAPEVLTSGGWGWTAKYGPKCDLWSCGVVLYATLSGTLPFNGRNDADLIKKLKIGKFGFPTSKWADVSEGGKELIRNLLKLDVEERFSAEEARLDEWVTKRAPGASGHVLQASHLESFGKFRASHALRRTALQVIARHVGEADLKGLREIFHSLDEEGNGTISVQEFKEAVHQAKLPQAGQAQLEGMFDAMDVDQSGLIDYTEFLAAALTRRQYMDEDVCWAAFKVFDTDNDGRISLKEMTAALASGSVSGKIAREQAQTLMSQVDLNNDGSVDFDEFKKMLAKQ